MRTIYHHLFNKSKVKQQIILIFLFAAVIPMIIFGIFAIFTAKKQMLDQYKTQVSSDAMRVNSTLFDITTSIYTPTENIVETNDCRTLLSSNYTSDEDMTYYNYLLTSLRNFRNHTAAVSSITIYTDNPSLPASDHIVSLADGYSDQKWYAAIDAEQWSSWICFHDINRFNHETYELTLVKRIALISSSYTAYLVVRLDSNYIRNRLLQNDYLILASIDDGPIYFSSETAWIGEQIPMPEDFNHDFYKYTGAITIADQKMLSNITTFLPYKATNKFYICVCDPDAYHNINRITLIYSIILLIAIIFPAFIIMIFSSYFSKRVTALKKAMHQASLGDYNIVTSFHGDDELAETFQDLQNTVQQIHHKEKIYYETKIKEQQLINNQQQMEFKMLSSQINPHFLYNTLETIRMQALTNDNKEVASSIKLLGKSMRYVLKNTGTDSTTLAREIEYIEIYLSIQRLRFGSRVNYRFCIPEGFPMQEYKILPLLLQPVVENAIVHGLEGIKENGNITISIAEQNNMLLITVEDNGEGIDPETLKNLLVHINSQTDSSCGIGLFNINQRIKLMYGPPYGLSITSVPSVGTKVTITLPKLQGDFL